MAQTRDVSATEFSRNFARYREEAIAEKIIRVTSHGRVIGAYLSASEAAHYEELKRRERQSLVVGKLPDDVIAAIESPEYGTAPLSTLSRQKRGAGLKARGPSKK